MRNPIDGFGIYKRRDGSLITLDCSTPSGWLFSCKGGAFYDKGIGGNLVMYPHESEGDIVEKVSSRYNR